MSIPGILTKNINVICHLGSSECCHRNRVWKKVEYVRKLYIVLIFCILLPSPDVIHADQFNAKVVKVIDGDSIMVVSKKGKMEIRLYGIDCPEYDQPFSRKAKAFTKSEILGKKVTVEKINKDRYGRLVALISCQGRTINRQLVKVGLAWVHPRYCKRTVCNQWQKDEYSARDAKVGLWSQDHQTPPWVWKRVTK